MNHRRKIIRTLSLVSQLGITMLVSVFLCVFVGKWLEEHLHLPLTVPFIIIGVLAGARGCYVLVRAELKREEEESRSSEAEDE